MTQRPSDEDTEANRVTMTALEWERPWEKRGHAADSAIAVSEAVVESTGQRLEAFAETLDLDEQRALRQLVDQSTLSGALLELRSRPPRDLFSAEEIGLIESQLTRGESEARLRSSLHVVMKATRLCNLRCTYCNYWAEGPGQIMTFETMLATLHGSITDPNVRQIEFIWHGGEPTILGTRFFERALWLQQLFRRPGQTIRNRTQTNAVRLPQEFIEFWKRYDFIVGVSLDGPPEIHDRRRLDRMGNATAARAREGLDRLRAADIDPRILLVCDDEVVSAGARTVLSYLLEIGVRRVGLLNVVPENTPQGVSERGAYLSWPRYIEFLREMFDLWYPDHVDAINLREIADLTSKVLGGPGGLCNFAGDCFGSIYTVEPHGALSACDRYLNVESKQFGSVNDSGFGVVAEGAAMQRARVENAKRTDETLGCRWHAICNGGCPHDRDLSSEFLAGWDSGCCGLSPLLDHITRTLDTTRQPIGAAAAAALQESSDTPLWLHQHGRSTPPQTSVPVALSPRRTGPTPRDLARDAPGAVPHP